MLPAGLTQALAGFARDRTLVALDFDGTLAAITGCPRAAQLRRETRGLLDALTARYPCVIVTGRTRGDVEARVRPVRIEVIGNHGVDAIDHRPDVRRAVARARQAMAPVVSAIPGAWLEDKQDSLALHYRHAENRGAARRTLSNAATAVSGVVVLPGKAVLNVVARGAPDKRAAIDLVRQRRRCRKVIYIGDDETDETVFRPPRQRLLGIRVGRPSRTHAQFRLPAQRDVDRVLLALVRLRDAARP
jgi:trehalose 6-phosphate phosphatase